MRMHISGLIFNLALNSGPFSFFHLSYYFVMTLLFAPSPPWVLFHIDECRTMAFMSTCHCTGQPLRGCLTLYQVEVMFASVHLDINYKIGFLSRGTNIFAHYYIVSYSAG